MLIINKSSGNHLRSVVKASSRAQHRQHRLGAALIRGGNIISLGWNHGFIHAEHSVLNRAWRSDTDGCTLLVIRLKKDGNLGLAKPCSLCVERLIQAGIRKVTYSDENGQLVDIRLPARGEESNYLEYNFLKPSREGV